MLREIYLDDGTRTLAMFSSHAIERINQREVTVDELVILIRRGYEQILDSVRIGENFVLRDDSEGYGAVLSWVIDDEFDCDVFHVITALGTNEAKFDRANETVVRI